MVKLLSGAEVSSALDEMILAEVGELKSKGINPTLAIIRVGERGDDIAYENAAEKRCKKLGISVKKFNLSVDTNEEELIDTIKYVNNNESLHGCLLFRPLPAHIIEERVRNVLCSEKDIDGITDGSLAGVFSGTNTGFPPCTAQACMEILSFYGCDLNGKNVAVIGRSLVIGRPVSMMLMHKNATVTICHTKTTDMPSITKKADILVVAAGKAHTVTDEYLSEGQIVIDVGINVDQNGKLCGDVGFDEAKNIVKAITPVPGGVGTVTTSVLVKHVVEAAKRTLQV